MRHIYFVTLSILASATLGLAQFDNIDLSKSCEDEMQKIAGSKEINDCFPIASLAPLISSKTVDPGLLKNAADAICAAPVCSDTLVSQTQKDFKTACDADLKANNNIANYIDIAFNLYSPTRDSVCFKNSTDGYCFIESYTAANKVIDNAPKNQNPLLIFAAAPKEVVCTPCNKAIANTYLNYQKKHPEAFTNNKLYTSDDLDTAKNALTGKCGQDFLDGNVGDSKQSPATFLKNASKSDASSVIASGLSFVALAGSILALL